MADLDLRQISESGKPPATRIADAVSLNNVIKKIVARDLGSALNRQDVQEMLDGKPPFVQEFLRDSGQDGRCNLNFLDGKRRVKREQMGYYDLTDSVPMLGQINSTFGTDIIERTRWNMIMSEELHRMVKDWPSFSAYFQLLVQKFTSHGLGFLYFEDDLNWKWHTAGLEDFKLPRGTTLAEEEVDIAIAFRDITTAKLYSWIKDVPDTDKRWNKQQVYQAILKSTDRNLVFSVGEWEKWQQMLKNNDIYAATMAQDVVKLAHAWVREYNGRVSQYLTLRNGENTDFLFKCENRFTDVHQCFTFFPYEVGTNGTLHSVRGLGHEIYPQIQVINSMRCQLVDNAKLAGTLLLQPENAASAEDLAIMFYAGATYIPPGVKVQNQSLSDPTRTILPVLQDMSMSLSDNRPNINADREAPDKTKWQAQKEAADEATLPTASLDLFYQPWKRHLNEVWRRVRNKSLKQSDPGAVEVFDFRKRCMQRGVPEAALYDPTSWIEPMRAIGYGSPGNRLLALDEFMQYYGSLDPVGQNNLLRDRFAQKVGYAQVDRYVPPIDSNGRQPVDSEIAELQNGLMSMGKPCQVRPNDHHILHMQYHLPSLEEDLDNLESGQASPELLQVAQLKTQHAAQHMQLLKPDKLTEKVVAELTRRFNNDAERTSAALDHAQRQAAKQQQQGAGQPSPEEARAQQLHDQKLKFNQDAHEMKMQQRSEEGRQKLVMRDAEQAGKARAQANLQRLKVQNQGLAAAA